MKKVYLSKEPAPDPIIRLVQGDTDTQIITFRVPQFAGGVDLKDHEWSVLFHGEHGQHDVSFIGKGELHGSLIEFNWTVPSAVCKCPGRTWIMPEGIMRNEDGTGTVWRSESRCIYVAPAVIAKPGEIEHVLQPYQDLIVTLLGECKELKPIVDELEERVEKLDEEVPHDILAELAGKANQAEVDRISESVDTIGGALAQTQDKVEEIDGELAGKADKTELAGKADSSRVDQVAANADFAITQLGNKANTVHSHQIVDVNGLQGTLNMYTELIGEKAPRNHTHRIANVDGLQNELDTVNQHFTNLETAVNGQVEELSLVKNNLTYTDGMGSVDISNMVLPTGIGSYNKTEGYGFSDYDGARYIFAETAKTDTIKGAKSLKISVKDGIKYSRQLFSRSKSDLNGMLEYQLFNDSAWQTGTTIIDLTKYDGAVAFGLLRYDRNISDDWEISVIVEYDSTEKLFNAEEFKEIVSQKANASDVAIKSISDIAVIPPKTISIGKSDIETGTYTYASGYTINGGRGMCRKYYDGFDLVGAKTITFKVSSTTGRYSRQLFYRSGESRAEAYNDTSWQSGETTLNISDYIDGEVVSFGLLTYDKMPTEVNITIVIEYGDGKRLNNTDRLAVNVKGEWVYGTLSDLKSYINEPCDENAIGTTLYPYTGSQIKLTGNRYIMSKYEKINPSIFNTSGWLSTTPQSMCVYEDYMFICYTSGGIGVFDMKNKTAVGSFKLPLDDNTLAGLHGSNCCFGVDKLSGSDYPAFYVSETTAGMRCFVFKINSLTSASHVQTISFDGTFGNPSGRNYRDFLVDSVHGAMYVIGYYNYTASDNHMIVKKTAIPNITQSTVSLADADVLDSFTAQEVKVIQGARCVNGILYVGNNGGTFAKGVNVYDLYAHRLLNVIPTPYIGEPEGVEIYDNALYIMDVSNQVYKCVF